MYFGNQYTQNKLTLDQQQQEIQEETFDNLNQTEPAETASSSKIQDILTDTPKQSDKSITGYRFIDIEILTCVVAMLSCPECQTCTLNLHENFSKKDGICLLSFYNLQAM